MGQHKRWHVAERMGLSSGSRRSNSEFGYAIIGPGPLVTN